MGAVQDPPLAQPAEHTGVVQPVLVPVQPVAHEHTFGEVHVPPLAQATEQTGAAQVGPFQLAVQVQVFGFEQVPPLAHDVAVQSLMLVAHAGPA